MNEAMTDTSKVEQPCAVPLEEMLESIPKDAVYQYTETAGLKAWHNIPIGRMAHEAAATLRELVKERDGMREALRDLIHDDGGSLAHSAEHPKCVAARAALKESP